MSRNDLYADHSCAPTETAYCDGCEREDAPTLVIDATACGRCFRAILDDLDPPAEKVHHPRHYNAHPSGIEAIILCEQASFNVGTAWKYGFRAGKKVGEAADLDFSKMRWYLAQEVVRTALASCSNVVMDTDAFERYRTVMRSVIDAEPETLLGTVLAAYFDLMTKPDGALVGSGWVSGNTPSERMLSAFDRATDGRFMSKKENA